LKVFSSAAEQRSCGGTEAEIFEIVVVDATPGSRTRTASL
jgi:hypothetical protein